MSKQPAYSSVALHKSSKVYSPSPLRDPLTNASRLERGGHAPRGFTTLDHYRGTDPDGFGNWHIIAGAVIGFGTGDSATALQQWYLENPILPSLCASLDDSLGKQDCPHGIKILFGGDRVAEVRVDGEYHDVASRSLGALSWPTLEPAGFVRSYIVALHREAG